MGTCNEGVCCTEAHEFIKTVPELWERQRFIGLQPIDEETCLEMRNCVAPGCESTLAVEVPMTEERVKIIRDQRAKAKAFREQVDAARAQYARAA